MERNGPKTHMSAAEWRAESEKMSRAERGAEREVAEMEWSGERAESVTHDH